MNPAERMSEILQIAKAQEPHATVSQAWANTFKIPQSKDANLQYMEVLPYLSLLGAEFSLLKEYINQDNSLDPNLTGSVMGGVQSILGSVTVLSSQWQPYSDRIQDGLLRELGWLSRDYKNKSFAEEKIPEGELENLLKEISELEELINKSNLTEPIRQMTLHHLDIIKKAISYYPIIGAKAFYDAVVKGTGEWATNEEFLPSELSKEENNDLRKGLQDIWRKSTSYVDKMPKYYGWIRIGTDITSKVKEAIEFFSS